MNQTAQGWRERQSRPGLGRRPAGPKGLTGVSVAARVPRVLRGPQNRPGRSQTQSAGGHSPPPPPSDPGLGEATAPRGLKKQWQLLVPHPRPGSRRGTRADLCSPPTVREWGAPQVSPVRTKAARDPSLGSWSSKGGERQSTCLPSRPSWTPSSGKVSSPPSPLPPLPCYSCLFCSFGTYCLVTSCTAPSRGSVM